MEAYKLQFVKRAALFAHQANHPFENMAACEAALESGFGTSGLSIQDNNLFGMKQHAHPIYGTHTIPTKEFSKQHGWFVVNAEWVKYPSWRECFADRLATLQRLSSVYPHYAAALKATTATEFVTEVSKTWSTDPNRAQKVIEIYHAAFGVNATA